MAIVRYTTEDLKKMPSLTDQDRVKKNIKDDNIDFSDLPELDEKWFAGANRPGRPKKALAEAKESISIRLSPKNLEFLRRSKGWQTRIDDLITGWRISSGN
ncbi:hypothetical protein FACS189479_04570 [Spirochaetia bacterium]|nr:hypothetical protein FACS189479_04570 [Spirochaetia bacterium]